jgi:hypothetical protein
VVTPPQATNKSVAKINVAKINNFFIFPP